MITLQRSRHDKVTPGQLGGLDILTLELPFKNNQPLISCIPQGIYNCKPYNSEKFPNTWEILNVPGRSSILFHVGNFACDVVMLGKEIKSDTQGCILVGLGMNESIPMLTNSKAGMKSLREKIKGNWSIHIKDYET
jgi:hypothetical protein